MQILTAEEAREIAETAARTVGEEFSGKLHRPIMTIEQVCEYTQLSRTQIYRLQKQGFPFVKRPGVPPRFFKSDVDAWLKGEL